MNVGVFRKEIQKKMANFGGIKDCRIYSFEFPYNGRNYGYDIPSCLRKTRGRISGRQDSKVVGEVKGYIPGYLLPH